MNRVKKLIETIRTLMNGEFSGYLKINFSQGSLGRVEQSEELDVIAADSEVNKSKNKNEDKDSNSDNVIRSSNATYAKGSISQYIRPGHDRRSGNNHYTGHESRSGTDRRSDGYRPSCEDRNAQVAAINEENEVKSRNIINKQNKNNVSNRDKGLEE